VPEEVRSDRLMIHSASRISTRRPGAKATPCAGAGRLAVLMGSLVPVLEYENALYQIGNSKYIHLWYYN
jgi:hypothetical protein